jgi:hypothetical protein
MPCIHTSDHEQSRPYTRDKHLETIYDIKENASVLAVCHAHAQGHRIHFDLSRAARRPDHTTRKLRSSTIPTFQLNNDTNDKEHRQMRTRFASSSKRCAVPERNQSLQRGGHACVATQPDRPVTFTEFNITMTWDNKTQLCKPRSDARC